MDLKKLIISPINEIDDLSNFSCNDPDLDDFIQNDALGYQNRLLAKTYLCRKPDKSIAGFYSVTMDSVKKRQLIDQDEFNITNIPAFKIARLAVHQKYQGLGVRRFLLYTTIYQAKKYSTEIGCRLVTVDSKPESVDFYLRHEFKPTSKIEKQKYPTLYLDLMTIQD